MNLIHAHIITEDRLNDVTLCPSVEYEVRDSAMMFYNTAFDSVFLIRAKSNSHALRFVRALEWGSSDFEALVNDCLAMNVRDVVVAMYQKRIIE